MTNDESMTMGGAAKRVCELGGGFSFVGRVMHTIYLERKITKWLPENIEKLNLWPTV